MRFIHWNRLEEFSLFFHLIKLIDRFTTTRNILQFTYMKLILGTKVLKNKVHLKRRTSTACFQSTNYLNLSKALCIYMVNSRFFAQNLFSLMLLIFAYVCIVTISVSRNRNLSFYVIFVTVVSIEVLH